jgi:hypothetical protein
MPLTDDEQQVLDHLLKKKGITTEADRAAAEAIKAGNGGQFDLDDITPANMADPKKAALAGKAITDALRQDPNWAREFDKRR